MRDYAEEATALFTRFAERHRLKYEVVEDAPVEVWWTFPPQENLTHKVVLALQNNDELNFGVVDFWSYFFPYETVATDFESFIDAWVVGNARIAVVGGGARLLQVRAGDDWNTVYGAGGCLFPTLRPPKRLITNVSLSN